MLFIFVLLYCVVKLFSFVVLYCVVKLFSLEVLFCFVFNHDVLYCVERCGVALCCKASHLVH